MRLLLIQHGAGHGSFFQHRRTNDTVGRILDVMTLTLYEGWRRTHAMHHATGCNLDRRGTGDVTLLTVAEQLALPPLRRVGNGVLLGRDWLGVAEGLEHGDRRAVYS